MTVKYLVLSILLISIVYSLYFGSPDQSPSTVLCKHSLFKTALEKKYSYIYSSVFFGCKQRTDKSHYGYLPYFYNTSTGHLLCISGLHVGSLTLVVFLSFNLIFYFFLPSFRRKGLPYFYFSLPIGVIVSILYVFFIGPEIPRLRAIIMLLFAFVALFLPVFKNKLLVLALTASILLCFIPDSIYSYSFYYSFIAVLAIFLSSIKRTIHICFIIYLFLVPLNLHSSGYFDLNNILANFIVIPFFSFIYYPFNILCVLLFLSGIHGVIYIMNLSTDLLIVILRFFSWISDFTKIKTLHLDTKETLVLYVVLILFFFCFKYSKSFNKRKTVSLYLAIAIISIIVCVQTLCFGYRHYKGLVNFEIQKQKMFAGSGDVLFISDGVKNIIVDTGFGKLSSQKIIRKIKKRKINVIDYLIITHSDVDHVGGIKDFLNEFSVHNIIISRLEYAYFLQNGLIHKTRILFACKGMSLDIGKTSKIRFLNPACYYKYRKRMDRNELALSFIMNIDDYTFVINSDVPKKRLKNILQENRLAKSNLIYQMPHHCSKRDNPPDLLNTIKPLFGFCTRDRSLLERSSLYPTDFMFPILMTGVCGDIDIRLENSGLQVFSEKCSKLSLQLKGS